MVAVLRWRLPATAAGLLLALTAAGAAGPMGSRAVPRDEAAAAQALPPQEQRVVLKSGAIDPADATSLQELLKHGSNVACCGRWRDRAAARLQLRVASELGISERRLSDVRMANSTMSVWASAESSKWGRVVVLYLDDSPNAKVSFEGGDGQRSVVDAPRGTILVASEGEQVVHEEARAVAWLRVLHGGVPDRTAFEFFVASGIHSSFVAPHNTLPQQRFLRSHTRHPAYWHRFFWSFLGLFCTILACLPLAWWGIQLIEQWLASSPEDATVTAEQSVVPSPDLGAVVRRRSRIRLPTLLASSGSSDQLQSQSLTTRKWAASPAEAAALP